MGIFGPELVANWSFEQGQPSAAPGTFTSQVSIPGWTTVAGSAPLEIVKGAYPFPGGLIGPHGTHWLDTQASPGGIDIKQTINDGGNEWLQVDVTVSLEKIGALMTNPDAVLKVVFDGEVIDTIGLADFTTGRGGAVQWNKFLTFSYEVAGSGPDIVTHTPRGDVVTPVNHSHTIELHDVTDPVSSVGFAIDSVSVHGLMV